MSDASIEYHNLQYAVRQLRHVISVCKLEKLINEKYQPQLENLIQRLEQAELMVKKEQGDLAKQREKWSLKIRSCIVDAQLDEVLDEDLKEKIMLSLEELLGSLRSYGKNNS